MRLMCYNLIVFALLIIGCKKNTDTRKIIEKNSLYHKDITITNDGGAHRTLGLFQSPDSKGYLFVGGRNTSEFYPMGFRIGKIEDSILWMKSYSLDNSGHDKMEIANQALLYNNNIYVGGHAFLSSTAFAKTYITKLDMEGNILFSKMFQTQASERLIALKILMNGDFLMVVNKVNQYFFYRLDSDLKVKFLKGFSAPQGMSLNDPYYVGHNIYYNIKHPDNLVENSNGDLYFGFPSTSPVICNYLMKLNSNGDVLFVKRYSVAGQSDNPSSPRLLLLNDNEIIYANYQKSFYLFRLDGQGNVITAKGIRPGYDYPQQINEVKFYNNKFYTTVCGSGRYANLILDRNFNVESIERVAESNVSGLGNGGISVIDYKDSKFMYTMLDDSGQFGGSGFQWIRSNNTGKSCHQFPLALVMPSALENINVVADDNNPFQYSTLNSLDIQDFKWNSVSSKEPIYTTVCSK